MRRDTEPTAGDLLIRAVDKWASHGMGCDLDDCAPCITLINQLKLAYKVWQSSAHKSARVEGMGRTVSESELRQAALALYLAGRWDARNVDGESAARMWERLRDALGLPKGTATSHGIAANEVDRNG